MYSFCYTRVENFLKGPGNPFCFAFKEQSIVKKAANLDKENNKKVKSKEELSDIEMEEAVDYETESESNHNCVFLVIFTLNF